MTISGLDQNAVVAFFLVLVRMGVLIAFLPLFGDRTVPRVVKLLFGLSVAMVLYPVLISRGLIRLEYIEEISNSAGLLISVIVREAVFALALAFVAKMVFIAVQVAAEVAANLMGFAAASMIDPHLEVQTQVLSKFYMALAMLIFLAIDGHHLMFAASVDSYKIVSIGSSVVSAGFSESILSLSGEMIRIGMQLASPMAISIFGVYVVYAVMARAMPQLNILILSFSVSALVGLVVLFVSLPEFHHSISEMFGIVPEHMFESMRRMVGK